MEVFMKRIVLIVVFAMSYLLAPEVSAMEPAPVAQPALARIRTQITDFRAMHWMDKAIAIKSGTIVVWNGFWHYLPIPEKLKYPAKFIVGLWLAGRALPSINFLLPARLQA